MFEQWNPINDLMVLQDQMNRLFEDVTQRRARAEAKPRDDIERADWIPAADVYEQEDQYIVALDLPGVDRSALEITLDNDRLAIRGTRSLDHETSHRAERPRGRFVRTFGVPASVDQERIEADYRDGVLFVRLPKRTEEKSQRVQIKVS
jgi:HSP20 family protein